MPDLTLRMSAEERLEAYEAGRKLGGKVKHERSVECRTKWRDKAARLTLERPNLSLDQLAMEICVWCRQNCIRMGNGRYYSLRTILDDLRAQRINRKN